MSDTTNVCRLCLNIIPPDKFSAFDANITEKLKLLIPNLTLTPVTNLSICKDCHECLEETSKLKRTCSSSNKLIKFLKNYLGVDHAVELKELIKGNHKKQEENWPKHGYVCRICLKSNEGQYTSIADTKTEEFGLVFSSCLSILEENLTTNPLICKICIDVLHKMCAFVKQCHDVEVRVISYSKSVPGEVDLFKVINPVNDDLIQQTSQESKEKEVPNEEERPSTEKLGDNPNQQEDCLKDEGKLLIEDQGKDVSKMVPKEDVIVDIPAFKFGLYLLHHYKGKVSIKQWLDQVDEIKSAQHLSDQIVMQKILKMMKSMTRPVHEYFSSLVQSLNWAEFKEKLQCAFPDRDDDYFVNMEKLLSIKKKEEMTFVEYYKEKMGFMKRFNFTEKQIVSFLVGGVSNPVVSVEIRIAGYDTPKEVLEYFKDCDSGRIPLIKRRKRRRRSSKEKCVCCDKSGHSSVDCPLITNKAQESQKIEKAADGTCQNQENVVPGNSLSSGSPKEQLQKVTKSASEKSLAQEKPTENQNGSKCACCDKFGHCSMTCPMLRNKLDASRTEKSNSVMPKPKQQEHASPKEKCSACDKPGHSSHACPLVGANLSPPKPQTPVKTVLDKESLNAPVNKVQEPHADDLISDVDTPNKHSKCSCCDKLGHTSVNCPFVEGKSGDIKKTNVIECFTCGEMGHRARNCHEKKSEDVETPSKNCWRCKQGGHLSFNCPLAKINVNASTASDVLQVEPNNIKETPTKKCPNCKQAGHEFKNCPLLKPNSAKATTQKQTAAQTPNKIKESLTNNNWNLNQPGPLIQNYSLPNNNIVMANNSWQTQNGPQMQTGAPTFNNYTEATPQKCLICNQFGHLFQNCPLSNTNSFNVGIWHIGNGAQMQTPGQPSNNTVPVLPPNCWFCKQPGHPFQSCSMFRNNVAKAQAQHFWPNIEKCSTCNIYGHSSSNCAVVEAVKVNAMPWIAQPPEERKAEAPQPQINTPQPPSKTNRKRRCLCCNNVDHSSLDCPLLKNNKSNSLQQPVNAHKPQEPEKCLCCNKTGHPTWNCSYYSFFKTAVSQTEHANVNEGTPATKRAKLEEKCCFCDQTGHSSSDCFRTRFEQREEATARAESPEVPTSQILYTDPSVVVMSSQSLTVCEFCKKIGHSVSDCFEAAFDRKTHEARHGSGSSHKCRNCGHFGHLSSDCSKKKSSSRKEKTSKRKQR